MSPVANGTSHARRGQTVAQIANAVQAGRVEQAEQFLACRAVSKRANHLREQADV
jgi:hypothetical protein